MFSPSEQNLSEAEEALYNIIVPENQKEAINMDDFTDLYGAEAIARDKAYLEKRERNFEEGDETEASKKAGRLFEAIVNRGVREINLMGPRAMPIVPSRYDDVARGIDSIIQFKGERGATSHIALGIDVSRSTMGLSKKFSNIIKSVKSGELSTAKYFKTKNFRGEFGPVVRVVIGADKPIAESITDLLLREIRMRETIAKNRARNDESESAKALPKEFAKNRTALAEHPLQWVVLFEMKEQLEAFRDYATRIGKEQVADECAKILHIIDGIIEDKKAAGQFIDNVTIEEDEMFRLIRKEIEIINGL